MLYNKEVAMSIGGLGGSSGVLSNLFCDARSGPSKYAQAREAGLAARKSQQAAFAGQLQGLIEAGAAQIQADSAAHKGTAGTDWKYVESLKIRNRIEQGMSAIADTQVQKASEANLEEIKKRIEENAQKAQEERDGGEQVESAGDAANAAPTGSDTEPVIELPGAGGLGDSASAPQVDLPTTDSADVQMPAIPGVSTSSTPSTSSSGSAPSGHGRHGRHIHVDVTV
jgi:hypothetical protein